MMDWPAWALAVFAYVIVQRLAELLYADANTRRLLAEGGREYGRGHYPFFFLLHGGWLLAIGLIAQPDPQPNLPLLIIFIASQGLRFWTLASIGRWWTTRIISAPHFPRILKGPYRYVSHPNYIVVAIEIATLPLLLGNHRIALAFSLGNAILLLWRIRVESKALAERGAS